MGTQRVLRGLERGVAGPARSAPENRVVGGGVGGRFYDPNPGPALNPEAITPGLLHAVCNTLILLKVLDHKVPKLGVSPNNPTKHSGISYLLGANQVVGLALTLDALLDLLPHLEEASHVQVIESALVYYLFLFNEVA
mgnify:FL=1